jgi:predicted Zn-dependent protease
MMKRVFVSHRIFLVLILVVPVLLQCKVSAQDKLLDILSEELNREMSVLKAQDVAPYYMSYRVTEVRKTSITALSGAIVSLDTSSDRKLDVAVRVGDYSMDNTHQIRGDYGSSYRYGAGSGNMVIENDPIAVKSALWSRTNDMYRAAVERYANVKTNKVVKVAAEDSSADFSRIRDVAKEIEQPLDYYTLRGDITTWVDKVKRFSALFLESKEIFGGRVTFSYSVERKYFVSSEGTGIVQNTPIALISLSGLIKANDGMELPLRKSYSAFDPRDLPGDDVIISDIRAMTQKLEALSKAPLVDPFAGPAILSGRASGVFMHEVFGHRVEGHRQKDEREGQTFKKKVNEQLLPAQISIIFDPALKQMHGFNLFGYYKYDDEGVCGRRVEVVQNGVFRDFLMSRSPIDGFPVSNGHGRAQGGASPVARQSNLIVTTTSPLTSEQLRRKLIDECKTQGKEFGLYFADIQEGYTMTGRGTPNVFNVTPVEVYRIYIDGRPDELVRGVDIIGTPLSVFAKITDVGDTYDLFNGYCGAESGQIPVASLSPPILVSQIEVQKKAKSQDRPAVLPRPDTEIHINQ